jgi:hypothetical protein
VNPAPRRLPRARPPRSGIIHAKARRMWESGEALRVDGSVHSSTLSAESVPAAYPSAENEGGIRRNMACRTNSAGKPSDRRATRTIFFSASPRLRVSA